MTCWTPLFVAAICSFALVLKSRMIAATDVYNTPKPSFSVRRAYYLGVARRTGGTGTTNIPPHCSWVLKKIPENGVESFTFR